jgi:hypothetical protein
MYTHTAIAASGAVCVAGAIASSPGYQLRFESLFNPGRAMAFPCDERGRVELDALSDAARRNYLYARAVVGREFATPTVVPGDRS